MKDRVKATLRNWLGVTQSIYVVGDTLADHKAHITQLEADLAVLLAYVQYFQPIADTYFAGTGPFNEAAIADEGRRMDAELIAQGKPARYEEPTR